MTLRARLGGAAERVDGGRDGEDCGIRFVSVSRGLGRACEKVARRMVVRIVLVCIVPR